MRKMVTLVAMATLLALGAGAALAQEGSAGTTKEDGVPVIKAKGQRIFCTTVPCFGTGTDDLVFERAGNGKRDRIILRGGDDQVRANTYGNDRDTIKGTSGFDVIYADDGDTRDRIFGGKGNDKCFVDARSEAVAGCSRIVVQ